MRNFLGRFIVLAVISALLDKSLPASLFIGVVGACAWPAIESWARSSQGAGPGARPPQVPEVEAAGLDLERAKLLAEARVLEERSARAKRAAQVRAAAAKTLLDSGMDPLDVERVLSRA